MSVCVNAGLLSELLMLTGIADFGLLNYSCFAEEESSAVAFPLASICCGKPKPSVSPLRKQGSTPKKLDSCFRRNDKCCFLNMN